MRKLRLILVGVLISLFFTIFCSSGTVIELKDSKGRVYAKKTVKEGEDGKQVPVSAEVDKDRDGKMDTNIAYNDLGQLRSVAVDKDSNGQAEYAVNYKTDAEKLTRDSVDIFNPDGSDKAKTYYDETGQKIVMVEINTDKGKRRAYYKDGKLTKIEPPAN